MSEVVSESGEVRAVVVSVDWEHSYSLLAVDGA